MLRPLAAAHKILPLEKPPLQAIIAGVRGADTTKLDHWRALRVFYNWLTEVRTDLPNPMKKYKRPQVSALLPSHLSATEIDALLWANQRHPRDRALILTILDTGFGQLR